MRSPQGLEMAARNANDSRLGRSAVSRVPDVAAHSRIAWRMAEQATQAMVSLWRTMEYRTFGKPYVTGRHFDRALISGVL
jgi:hypothetical protein